MEDASAPPVPAEGPSKAPWWVLRLLGYMRPYVGAVISLGLLVLTAAGLNLLAPWPMQLLVDYVFTGKPLPAYAAALSTLPAMGQVAILALASLLFSLGATSLWMWSTWRETVLGQRLVLDLREQLFGKLLRQSVAFHQRRELGDTISRVADDTWCIHTLTLNGLLPLTTASVQLVGLTWVLFRLDAALALVALAVMPLLILCVRAFGEKIGALSTTAREREAHLYQVIQEVFGALRIVHLFAREPREEGRFSRAATEVRSAQQQLTRTETWFGLAVDVVTHGGRAAVLLLGGWHVLQGRLTLGELLVVMSYLANVYAPISEISGTIGTMQSSSASARRVFEMVDHVPDVQDRPGARPLDTARGHLEFRDVHFAYRSEEPVMSGLTFQVKPGETVALVGPSGAGKSTIAALIPRLYDVTAGSVSIDGQDVREVTLRSLREQISVVPQEVALFAATVADNIRYGRLEATDAEVIEAARAAQAHEFISRLPEGYDTVLEEHGEGLSGGERQRLALARAFVKRSAILILDEPTASLDVETEAALLRALQAERGRRTTLLIAHRLQTSRLADRILVVQRGQVVESGSAQQLLRAGGIYARLCRVSEGEPEALLVEEVFSRL